MNPEKTIERIEEISEKLTNPEIDTKTAMEYFEEGMNLVKNCYDEIKAASGKVTELKKELEKYTEIKFDEE